MYGIILEAIIRREVHAAAKPPDWLLAAFFRDKEAHVHMHSGDIGIARVEYQRDAHGLPTAACGFRVGDAGRGRQLGAFDV